jgi:hypothetical protein
MILIPTINPIRLSLSGVNEPKVEYAFYRDYYQKFQRTDSTKIQILIPDEEEVTDWALSAVSTDDETFSYTAPKKTFNNAIAEHQAVEYDIDFSQFPEGTFRFILQANNSLQYRSDIICVKNTHEHTRLLSYCNTYNEHGVAFSTGVVFHLRVETQLYKSAIPKSEGSTYTDNMGGYRTLTSSPYTNHRLNIGEGAGIPDWFITIINKAFSCDTLLLNHAEIVKSDGATLEPVEQDNYNLRSWNIEIGQIENNLFYQEHLLTINGQQQLSLNIKENAQVIPIILFATADWKVVENYPDWITVTPMSGNAAAGGQAVTISVAKNGIYSRSAVILFQLSNMQSMFAMLEINQADEVLYLLALENSNIVMTEEDNYVIDLKR